MSEITALLGDFTCRFLGADPSTFNDYQPSTAYQRVVIEVVSTDGTNTKIPQGRILSGRRSARKKPRFLLRPPVSHMDTWTNARMAFDFGEFTGYLRLPC